MTKKKSKVTKAWGGFSEGRLFKDVAYDNYEVKVEQFALYKTRKGARARFQDVRRVEIREL